MVCFVKRSWFRCGTIVLALAGLAFLLGGCQTTSEEIANFTPTGSWQGTLTDPQKNIRPVHALFAPNGDYQLAFDDGSGKISGNVYRISGGLGDATALIVSEASDGPFSTRGHFNFGYTLDSITGHFDFSKTERWNLSLQSTPDAATPAILTEVQRGWVRAQGNPHFPDIRLDQPGIVTDSDGAGCTYAGEIVQPAGWEAWNIFSLNLAIGRCELAGTYKGLATLMRDPAGDRLWVGLTYHYNDQPSASPFFIAGVWSAWNNEPPVANVGGNLIRPVLLNRSRIVLDGTGSSDPNDNDPNRDPLSYHWTVTAPDGQSSSLSDATSSTPSFVPDAAGDYTVTLTVNDGELSSPPQSATVTVIQAPARFIDNQNGTIVDALQQRVWLKQSHCLNAGTVLEFGVYKTWIEQQFPAGAGDCGLSDGSVIGDWKMPTATEFSGLLMTPPGVTTSPGAEVHISNAAETGWWSGAADEFVINKLVPGGLWYQFWSVTADGSSAPIFDLRTGEAMSAASGAYGWPMRLLRADGT